jgi:hypothetical protein
LAFSISLKDFETIPPDLLTILNRWSSPNSGKLYLRFPV